MEAVKILIMAVSVCLLLYASALYIKSGIEVRRAQKTKAALFGFLQDVNYRVVEPPLTEEEVSKLEELNEIKFPDEYRQFLTMIGNGIKIDLGDRDTRYIYGFPRPIERHINRRYKWDFIFETAYHRHLHTHEFSFPDDCIDIDDYDEEICKKCRHMDFCFYSDAGDVDDFDNVIYNGACPLCYAGCTYFYFLVLNGSHRGEVWINNEKDDFAPSKSSFCEFLKWVATSPVY